MMRRVYLILAGAMLAIGLLCSAQAQLQNKWIGGRPLLLEPVATGFSPSCSQSTAFLARATGVTLTADKTNYDNLICGLETDGVGCSASLDALYIFAAVDAATYKLNLCSSSFSLTEVGTVTFTQYTGVMTDGTTGYENTGFNPATAGGHFVQNSASLGVYDLTNDATYNSSNIIGTENANHNTIALNQLSAVAFFAINAPSNAFPVIATQQGAWVYTRTTSTLTTMLRNSASLSTTANVSGAMDSLNVFILATNSVGTPLFMHTTDKVAAAFIGRGFSVVEACKLSNRINTYLGAYSVNVYSNPVC